MKRSLSVLIAGAVWMAAPGGAAGALARALPRAKPVRLRPAPVPAPPAVLSPAGALPLLAPAPSPAAFRPAPAVRRPPARRARGSFAAGTRKLQAARGMEPGAAAGREVFDGGLSAVSALGVSLETPSPQGPHGGLRSVGLRGWSRGGAPPAGTPLPPTERTPPEGVRGAALQRSAALEENTGAFAFFAAGWLAWPDLPLSAGPALLAAGIAALPLTLLLLYDAATRGSLSRATRSLLEGAAPRRGLARDLELLFDNEDTAGPERFREAEAAALRSFLGTWRGEGEDGRAALAAEAVADGALWREKLLTAYLWEAAEGGKGHEERQDLILAALRRAQRARAAAVDPAARRLIARRAELKWLNHPRMLRALARLGVEALDASKQASREVLSRLAAERDPLVSGPAASALGTPRPGGGLARRLGLAGAALAVAGAMALSGAGALKTARLQEERAAARLVQAETFWGEDYFALDPLREHQYLGGPASPIAREVLDPLRDWWRTDEAARARLLRALEVLRDSPDPKADNVLGAVLSRADFLALTEESETLLLKTLVERDTEAAWDYVERYAQDPAASPEARRRLLTMIRLAAEGGREASFDRLFHFLKSPDEAISGKTSEAIAAILEDPARTADPLGRLEAAAAKHAGDPDLQLFVARRYLGLLGREDLRAYNLDDVERFLNGLRPGLGERLFEAMEEAMAEWRDRSGRVPDLLAEAVKDQLYAAAAGLVREGERLFPGLKERLILADVRKGGNAEELGAHVIFMVDGLRERYALEHFQRLAQTLAEASGEDGSPGPAQSEYLERASRLLDAMSAAGRTAGMSPGGAQGELADAVNAKLHEGQHKLGMYFLYAVVDAGFAPDVGRDKRYRDWRRLYRDSYSEEDLIRLRGFLADLLARGEVWDHEGNPRPMKPDEKVYLAEAVQEVRSRLGEGPDPALSALLRDAAAERKNTPVSGGAAASINRALQELHEAVDLDDYYGGNEDGNGPVRRMLESLGLLGEKEAGVDPAEALPESYDRGALEGLERELHRLLEWGVENEHGDPHPLGDWERSVVEEARGKVRGALGEAD